MKTSKHILLERVALIQCYWTEGWSTLWNIARNFCFKQWDFCEQTIEFDGRCTRMFESYSSLGSNYMNKLIQTKKTRWKAISCILCNRLTFLDKGSLKGNKTKPKAFIQAVHMMLKYETPFLVVNVGIFFASNLKNRRLWKQMNLILIIYISYQKSCMNYFCCG